MNFRGLIKAAARPPRGYHIIPGGKKGGYRKFVGGERQYDYWYPGDPHPSLPEDEEPQLDLFSIAPEKAPETVEVEVTREDQTTDVVETTTPEMSEKTQLASLITSTNKPDTVPMFSHSVVEAILASIDVDLLQAILAALKKRYEALRPKVKEQSVKEEKKEKKTQEKAKKKAKTKETKEKVKKIRRYSLLQLIRIIERRLGVLKVARMPEVAIYSPKGNGQMLVGRWDKPFSPKEMILANPTNHGFRALDRSELDEYQGKHGDSMPQSPGEWSTLEEPEDNFESMPEETPAAPRTFEQRVKAVASFEDFKTLYEETLSRMLEYTPGQAGSNVFAEKLALLTDTYPQFETRYDSEQAAPAPEPAPEPVSIDQERRNKFLEEIKELRPSLYDALRVKSDIGPGDLTGQELIQWHSDLHILMSEALSEAESSYFNVSPPVKRKLVRLRYLKNEHAFERDRLLAASKPSEPAPEPVAAKPKRKDITMTAARKLFKEEGWRLNHNDKAYEERRAQFRDIQYPVSSGERSTLADNRDLTIIHRRHTDRKTKEESYSVEWHTGKEAGWWETETFSSLKDAVAFANKVQTSVRPSEENFETMPEPAPEPAPAPAPEPVSELQWATPGTNLKGATLGEWIEAWGALGRRRISSKRGSDKQKHLEALPDAVVEAATDAEAEELEQIVRDVQPPRGMRAGHPTTRILDAINRRGQRVKPKKAKPKKAKPKQYKPAKARGFSTISDAVARHNKKVQEALDALPEPEPEPTYSTGAFEVGSTIAYTHDTDQVGVVVELDPSRTDSVKVKWANGKEWFVEPKNILDKPAPSEENFETMPYAEAVSEKPRLSEIPSDPVKYTGALAKLIRKFKKEFGASKVSQGYKGTGSRAAHRLIHIQGMPEGASGWLDRGGMTISLEDDHVGLGGPMGGWVMGVKIPYSSGGSLRHPDEVYNDLVLWTNYALEHGAAAAGVAFEEQQAKPAPEPTPEPTPEPASFTEVVAQATEKKPRKITIEYGRQAWDRNQKTATFETDGGRLEVWENSSGADGAHSIYSFLVDEEKRGQGIGGALVDKVVEKYAGEEISGQVSSAASLRVLHSRGFRPPGEPDASWEDVLAAFSEHGSLNMRLNEKEPEQKDNTSDVARDAAQSVRDSLVELGNRKTVTLSNGQGVDIDVSVSWNATEYHQIVDRLVRAVRDLEAFHQSDPLILAAVDASLKEAVKIFHEQSKGVFPDDFEETGEKAATVEEIVADVRDKLKAVSAVLDKPKQVTEPAVASPTKVKKRDSGITVVQGVHTRDGHDIWTAKLSTKINKTDFSGTRAIAKRNGGYYSRYGKGFIFDSEEAAAAFVNDVEQSALSYVKDIEVDASQVDTAQSEDNFETMPEAAEKPAFRNLPGKTSPEAHEHGFKGYKTLDGTTVDLTTNQAIALALIVSLKSAARRDGAARLGMDRELYEETVQELVTLRVLNKNGGLRRTRGMTSTAAYKWVRETNKFTQKDYGIAHRAYIADQRPTTSMDRTAMSKEHVGPGGVSYSTSMRPDGKWEAFIIDFDKDVPGAFDDRHDARDAARQYILDNEPLPDVVAPAKPSHNVAAITWQEVADRYGQLEDLNHHTDAAIFLAQAMGEQWAVPRLKGIKKEQEKEKSISPEQAARRDRIIKPIWDAFLEALKSEKKSAPSPITVKTIDEMINDTVTALSSDASLIASATANQLDNFLITWRERFNKVFTELFASAIDAGRVPDDSAAVNKVIEEQAYNEQVQDILGEGAYKLLNGDFDATPDPRSAPAGWERMPESEDKPEDGKEYLLIGDGSQPSIAGGNTWAESEISPDKPDVPKNAEAAAAIDNADQMPQVTEVVLGDDRAKQQDELLERQAKDDQVTAQFGKQLTDKQRREANDEALEVCRRAKAAGRKLTAEERRLVALYSGNGGIGADLNQYFTRHDLAESLWEVLRRNGLAKNAKVLEPACGSGVFLQTAPTDVVMEGVEIDADVALVAEMLHDDSAITNASFEEFSVARTNLPPEYDAVITNCPFGTRTGGKIGLHKQHESDADRYFIDTSLDHLKDGGLMAIICHTSVMSGKGRKSEDFRRQLAARAEIVDAFRLPDTAFKHAGTGVVSDIIIMRKRDSDVAHVLMQDADKLGFEDIQEGRGGLAESLQIHDADFVGGRWFDKYEDRVLGTALTAEDTNFRATVKGDAEKMASSILALTETPREWQNLDGDPANIVDMGDIKFLAKTDADVQSALEKPRLREQAPTIGDTKQMGSGRNRAHYVFGGDGRWHRMDDINQVTAVIESTATEVAAEAMKLAAELQELLKARNEKQYYKARKLRRIIAPKVKKWVAENGIPKSHAELVHLANTDPRLFDFMASVNPAGGLSNALSSDQTIVASKELDKTNLSAVFRHLTRQMSGEVSLADIKANWEGAEGLDDDGIRNMLLADEDVCVSLSDPSGTFEHLEDYLTGDLYEKLDKVMMFAKNPALDDGLRKKIEMQRDQLQKFVDSRKRLIHDIEWDMRQSIVPTEVLSDFLSSREGAEFFELLSTNKENNSFRLSGSSLQEHATNYQNMLDVGDKDAVRPFNVIRDPDTGLFSLSVVSPSSGKALFSDSGDGLRLMKYLNRGTISAGSKEGNQALRKTFDDMNSAFSAWIAAHPEHSDSMEGLYNRLFLGNVARSYSDAKLSIELDGLIAEGIVPHDFHNEAARWMQAVKRGVCGLDVGLGKTFVAIMANAEMRAKGLVQKSLFVVPKSVATNWQEEIQTLIPGTKVLVIGETQYQQKRGKLVKKVKAEAEARGLTGEAYDTFVRENTMVTRADTAAERNMKLAEAKQGDYDIILMAQPAFTKVPLKPETLKALQDDPKYRTAQHMANLRARDAIKANSKTAKTEEKRYLQLQASYEKDFAGKDFVAEKDLVFFEDLGIDCYFGDEAHAYKHLFAAQSRWGASPKFLGGAAESKRAFDMLCKMEFLRHDKPDAPIVFLTATPTKNSPLEIYNMAMHLDPDVFSRIGVNDPEEFIDRYCIVEEKPMYIPAGLKKAEQDADAAEAEAASGVQEGDGTVERVNAVTGFKNLSELQPILESLMMIRTAKDVGLEIPEHDQNVTTVDMTDLQDLVYEEIRREAEAAKEDEEKNAAMFRMLDQMRKAATDLSLYDAEKYPDEWKNSPKYKACVAKILANLENPEKGGQIVFIDYNAPHYALKQMLVDAGVPEYEIAICNAKETSDSDSRQRVSRKFNKGEIKVVIGNTGVMGEGMNLQGKKTKNGTTDIHHLDEPWDPGTKHQRNGRGIRQGNPAEKVETQTYLTLGSFDGYRHQTVKGKEAWLTQLRSGQDRLKNQTTSFDPLETAIMVSKNPEEMREKLEREAEAALGLWRAQEVEREIGNFHKLQKKKQQLARTRDEKKRKRLKASIATDTKILERSTLLSDAAKSALSEDSPTIVDSEGRVHKIGSVLEIALQNRWGGGTTPAKVVIDKVDYTQGKVSVRAYGFSARHLSYVPSLDLTDIGKAKRQPQLSIRTELADLLADAKKAAEDKTLSHYGSPGGSLQALPQRDLIANATTIRETLTAAVKYTSYIQGSTRKVLVKTPDGQLHQAPASRINGDFDWHEANLQREITSLEESLASTYIGEATAKRKKEELVARRKELAKLAVTLKTEPLVGAELVLPFGDDWKMIVASIESADPKTGPGPLGMLEVYQEAVRNTFGDTGQKAFLALKNKLKRKEKAAAKKRAA